jgi:hypothetical protein
MRLNTTLTLDSRNDGVPTRGLRLGLVVARITGEPRRTGEVVIVDGSSDVVFGRDSTCTLWRRGVATGPVLSPYVSRVQLVCRSAEGAIEVVGQGRHPLRVRGQTLDRAVLYPGDIVAVGKVALLVAAWVCAPSESLHGFGERDAHGLAGESAAVAQLRAQIADAADAQGHVLVLGETGTGKELVARALHAASRRHHRPLISRSAPTLPEGLLDAELFGHARNYPQHGMPMRRGLVGSAEGSTLFLDEIGEIGPASQAHLLRFLDSGEFQPLGEDRQRRADVRVVVATNRDPSELKHDLVQRFKIVIRAPALDERREDLPHLARLLRPSDSEELSFDELHALLHRPMPGNVRELERVLRSRPIGWLDAPDDAPRLALDEPGLLADLLSVPVAPDGTGLKQCPGFYPALGVELTRRGDGAWTLFVHPATVAQQLEEHDAASLLDALRASPFLLRKRVQAKRFVGKRWWSLDASPAMG